MPISATGNNRQRRGEAGFSLVELMVVVFLMGLISGVVALSLPLGSSSLEKEGQRLAARLTLAMEEAVVAGDVLGFGANTLEYGFFRLERGVWREIEEDRVFETRDWEPETRITLETQAAASARDADGALMPVVRFDPVGGMTPFVITLRQGGEMLRIVGEGNGSIRIEEDGNA